MLRLGWKLAGTSIGGSSARHFWFRFPDGRLAEGWSSLDQSGLIQAVTPF